MTPNPNMPTIARVRRLGRPTAYRVFLPKISTVTHLRQFDTAQDAIDWAARHLPNQQIDMQLS